MSGRQRSRAASEKQIGVSATLESCRRWSRRRRKDCPSATGDGKRCDPFTITDAHSRYLIRCQIVSRMDLSQVRAICEAAMREYGMPARIRTDNGAPFAGTGLLGLSKLSLGWMKLGIVHERIQADRPQQNGRHERMHRTLKEDTTKPPAASLRAQQSRSITSAMCSTTSARTRV